MIGILLGTVNAQESRSSYLEFSLNMEDATEALYNFQNLVKIKDAEGLKSLFYEELNDKAFIENAVQNMNFNKSLRSKLMKLKNKDIKFQPKVPAFIEEISKYPSLFYVEIYTKRRKGMDSIDGFYFARINGIYRLLYYLTAG